ncbi:MAG: CpsD/CapB family tyrosine-protein kinase [Acidobacteriia bacterium]|nr:CpsD/CapB family tyrosine-protein kinase [Terriglobia bacterium]
MSRIFDALRRSEQEKSGKGSSTPWTKSLSAEQPRVSLDNLPAGFEGVQRVALRIPPEKHIVTCGDNLSPGAERFRVLRHRLQRIRADRPLNKLLVSSAVPREGKTLVAINLAFSLARTSRRVLLIDADLRHPSVHEVLGIQAMPGLAEVLHCEIDARSAIRCLDPGNLYYLPAGRPPANPGELLQEPLLGELMKEGLNAFDWVVVDSAPITLFADTPHLAGHVDGTVLVTRVGVTPADAVQSALTAIEGNFVAGVVLNGGSNPSNGHYDNYYGDAADRNIYFQSEPEAGNEKS